MQGVACLLARMVQMGDAHRIACTADMGGARSQGLEQQMMAAT